MSVGARGARLNVFAGYLPKDLIHILQDLGLAERERKSRMCKAIAGVAQGQGWPKLLSVVLRCKTYGRSSEQAASFTALSSEQ